MRVDDVAECLFVAGTEADEEGVIFVVLYCGGVMVTGTTPMTISHPGRVVAAIERGEPEWESHGSKGKEHDGPGPVRPSTITLGSRTRYRKSGAGGATDSHSDATPCQSRGIPQRDKIEISRHDRWGNDRR